MQKPSCEYCGRCLSVCPSYQQHLVETMSPRARVDLCAGVDDGSLVAGPRFAESLSGCLQCLACTEICGKGVDGAAIVLEARLQQSMGTQHKKLSLARFVERAAVTWLLPRRRWLTRVIRILQRVQKFFPLETGGTVRHVPDAIMNAMGGGVGQRSLPSVSRYSLFDTLAPCVEPPKNVHCIGDVALFSGCFGGVINTDAAQSLVHLLSAQGYRVHIPPAQSCCAAPALLSGYGKAYRAAQLHNAAAFAALGDMPVLTLCATCHRTLIHAYGENVYSEADAALLHSFAARVVDAAVFLAALPIPLTASATQTLTTSATSITPSATPTGQVVSAPRRVRVAVHDPCHLRLHPESGLAARQCLQALTHVEVVELPIKGQCCGGGGISSLKNPEMADALGQKRAQMVLDAGVDVVVAQCPGCVLQLNNHLSRLATGSNTPRAQHLVHFLQT